MECPGRKRLYIFFIGWGSSVLTRVLFPFYHAVIESILRYGISAWFGNLSVQLKAQITRLTQRAMKMMGVKQHPHTPGCLWWNNHQTGPKTSSQIPPMSFSLFLQEDTSGLATLRTPLSPSIKDLNDKSVYNAVFNCNLYFMILLWTFEFYY